MIVLARCFYSYLLQYILYTKISDISWLIYGEKVRSLQNVLHGDMLNLIARKLVILSRWKFAMCYISHNDRRDFTAVRRFLYKNKLKLRIQVFSQYPCKNWSIYFSNIATKNWGNWRLYILIMSHVVPFWRTRYFN